MTTLQEQRMISAHQMGRLDYRQGVSMLAPCYLSEDEKTAYIAGYRGEAKRATIAERRARSLVSNTELAINEALEALRVHAGIRAQS